MWPPTVCMLVRRAWKAQRAAARLAEIAQLEARLASLRAEEVDDAKLEQQWQQHCQSSYEFDRIRTSDKPQTKPQEQHPEVQCQIIQNHRRTLTPMMTKPRRDCNICSKGEVCSCDDCHAAIAATGRAAVVAKLLEGVDFSSVFCEERFDEEDMDEELRRTLATFGENLYCAGTSVGRGRQNSLSSRATDCKK